MAFLPGANGKLSNSALVTEKSGKLWLVDTRSGAKRPVAGLPAVKAGGQGGLLDVVAARSFAADHRIYLTYSEPSAAGGSGLALARAVLAIDDRPKLQGVEVIWRNAAGGKGGQFGGIVVFAPDGKSLFLTSGERQRFTPAQDPNQPLGKILHLTLDGKPDPGRGLVDERLGSATVAITDPPSDTAAAKTATGRTFRWPGPNHTPAETWSSGHRNPYGLAFDARGRLWETEMGPRGGDELNLIVQGRNYGWPEVSEGQNYNGVPISPHATQPRFEAPQLSWVPSISPSSLLIYSGDLFPQWRGSGLIGALSAQALIRVSLTGDKARKLEQWDMGARIRFVAQGPGGAVYLLQDEGPLVRLDPVSPARRR
ncbi:MAG: PQQ-dependent sugar dehydrogenase [Sphingomicrobium sp.]